MEQKLEIIRVYAEDGPGAGELVEESLRLFLRRELDGGAEDG